MAQDDIPMDEEEFLNKFSRQNAAFGAETTMKLTKMKVLVVGVNGAGIEVAKNITLQGCGGVTLLDFDPVTMRDLGVNFFLKPQDIGQVKHDVLVPRLQELNPLCKVAKASAPLSPELIAAHSCVVITDTRLTSADLQKWNEECRQKSVSFIYVRSQGLFASVFVDHGDNHIINDRNGENPMVRIVESIENGENPLVRFMVPEGAQQGSFEDGGYIEFSPDIVGMDGLLDHSETIESTKETVQGWKITCKGSDPANSLRLVGDTSKFPPYVKGGTLTEKKVAEKVASKPFADLLKNPGMPFCDMVGTDMLDFGSELQMHLALATSIMNSDVTMENCMDKAAETLKSIEMDLDVNDKYIKNYTKMAGVELQPMACFLGGLVAQEVVKTTGKFTPIPGFWHFHALECLPSDDVTDYPTAEEASASRYGDLMCLFGKSFPTKLQNLNYFMVGCGALGCELLKNFALNGICCGDKASLTVTDADRIELSNLSRQFLFREHNVGQSKSSAAGAMAKEMNNDFKIKPLELFVGPKSEDTFNDTFWMGLDGVINALDNMEARFYVDEMCVKYEKSLLESSTMGPSGNVDPIVPHLTKTYRDGGQAVQGGGIPMCTLRNFPHLPDHCIEWARDQFAALFVNLPKSVEKFLMNPSEFLEDKRESTDTGQALLETRTMLSLMNALQSKSIQSAAQVAYDVFHMLFRDKIVDLTTAFPENARVLDPDTKEDKGPFWTGHKKFPKAAAYDGNNPTHWQFMASATNLVGVTIGVNPVKEETDSAWLKDQRSQSWINSVVSTLTIPEYIGGGVKLENDAENAAASGATGNTAKQSLFKFLDQLEAVSKTIQLPSSGLEEADFEKDDDFNFHIAFITHASNLRSDNYSIQNSDFQKVKLIAGRIIPAIATTTACVTGLVMLELFKIVLGKKDVESFRQRLVGLAVNTYTSFEADPPNKLKSGTTETAPDPKDLDANAFDEKGQVKKEFYMVEKYKAIPDPHCVWDKIVLPSADMTLGGLIDHLESEYNVTMTNWSFILGYKKEKEEKIPVSSPIYPAPPVFEPENFPPLDATQGEATKAIQSNANIPGAMKMRYVNEWSKAVKSGKLPDAPPKELIITENSTLKDILFVMARKADMALKDNPKLNVAIDAQTLRDRKFWLIPSDQCPDCETVPTYVDGDDEEIEVKHLAAIKIPLV